MIVDSAMRACAKGDARLAAGGGGPAGSGRLTQPRPGGRPALTLGGWEKARKAKGTPLSGPPGGHHTTRGPWGQSGGRAPCRTEPGKPSRISLSPGIDRNVVLPRLPKLASATWYSAAIGTQPRSLVASATPTVKRWRHSRRSVSIHVPAW